MPAFSPITLVDSSTDPSTNHVFEPTNAMNGNALFTNRAPARVADWEKLSVRVSAPTVSAGKGTSESVLTVPVPVEEQESCCVDKNAPTVNAFTVKTSMSIMSTAAQRDTMVALIRSYVNSTQFAAAVKGESFY